MPFFEIVTCVEKRADVVEDFPKGFYMVSYAEYANLEDLLEVWKIAVLDDPRVQSFLNDSSLREDQITVVPEFVSYRSFFRKFFPRSSSLIFFDESAS